MEMYNTLGTRPSRSERRRKMITVAPRTCLKVTNLAISRHTFLFMITQRGRRPKPVFSAIGCTRLLELHLEFMCCRFYLGDLPGGCQFYQKILFGHNYPMP